MNVGVITLIVVAILVVCGVIGLSTYLFLDYQKKDRREKIFVIPPPCSDKINIANLIQIPNTPSSLVQCKQNGQNTSLYYIGTLGNQQYDYVVAPWTTSPENVCVKFCKSYVNKVCIGNSINGVSAQKNFDNCMAQLNDLSCSPPTPIAAKGTTIYYPFVPTRSICDPA